MTAMYDPMAPYYDFEYGGKENDLAFYLDLARQHPHGVLEIGAGTGRITLPLAEQGTRITALDSSSAMLARAKENSFWYPKSLQDRIQWVHADMRSFELDDSFSLCILPFRTFLHNLTLDEQLQTLSHIHRHLNPGGRLVFDLFVPLYSVLAQSSWEEVIDEEDLSPDLRVHTQIHHAPVDQRLTITNDYHHLDTDTAQSVTYIYRYVFRHEMEALLRLSNFRIVAVYGGFEYQPYDFHSGLMVFDAVAL